MLQSGTVCSVERGRDHHHDDLTLQQRATMRCSVEHRVLQGVWQGVV